MVAAGSARTPIRRFLLAGGIGLAALAAGVTLAPAPAHAWWRGGVWVGGPGYYGPRYYGPRYYGPPVVVAPPPVYYAAPPPVYYTPPPVIYTPPPPAPYFPPGPPPQSTAVAAGGACITPARTCGMTVARAPGASCYCTDAYGQRVWGSVH